MKGKFLLYERRKIYGLLEKVFRLILSSEPYVFCDSFVRYPLRRINLIDIISTSAKRIGLYLCPKQISHQKEQDK